MSLFLVVVVAGVAACAAYLGSRTRSLARAESDRAGETYLIPTAALLDDLAADFEHQEAGAQLKAARAAMRATWSAQQLAEHLAAIDDERTRPEPDARTVATA